MTVKEKVEIVEVAPRDGFQAVVDPIPVAEKIAIVEGLAQAGFTRIETGAFVSPKAIPQMADTKEVHSGAALPEGTRLTTLVPNLRGANNALAAGITGLVYVFSVSESHNKSNVRRPVAASVDELAQLVEAGREVEGFHLRVNVATSFDCPYEGRIELDQVLPWLDQVTGWGQPVEFGICDTTGRAFPDQVSDLFEACLERYADAPVSFAFHGHDTYGLGVANALAAYHAGVRVFDAAAAGLGGCPFAPGATGNTASEDLVFTFENMNIPTGIDLPKLLDVAARIAEVPGASTGGHMRGLPRDRVLGLARHTLAAAS